MMPYKDRQEVRMKMYKKSKIDDFTNFMRWLWNNDRESYTLIMLGHTELITKELMDKYKAEREVEK